MTAVPGLQRHGGCAEDVGEPRPTQVWAMRGVDPEQVVVGRLEGSRRLVVYGRPHANPDDYFELSLGQWRVRGELNTTTYDISPST